MKKFARRYFLLLVVLASVLYGAENPQTLPRNKGNARYSVRPDYSRFFVLFRGPLDYQDQLQGNTLTLTIRGIASAPSDLGSNLKFQDGLIERAFVARIANAESKVILTLREGFKTYKIGKMEGLDALIIDILPDGKRAPVQPPIVPYAQKVKQQKPAPAQTAESNPTPLVDIAALARKQLEEQETKKTEAAAPAATRLAQEPVAPAQTIPTLSSSDIIILVLLSLSTLVTFGALIGLTIIALRRARSAGNAPAARELRNALLRHQSALRSGIQQPLASQQTGSAGQESLEVQWQEQDPELRALQLAEQYHRSQGEVDLAVRLREVAGAADSMRKVKTIRATGIPHKGKLTTAKKLGLGKGELDLASRLQHLKEELKEKEELA